MSVLSRIGFALLAAVTGGLWAFIVALWLNVAGLATSQGPVGQLATAFLLVLSGCVPGLLIGGVRPFSRDVAALLAGLIGTTLLGGPFVWTALSVLRAAPPGVEAWALYSLPFLPAALYGTYRAFATGATPEKGLLGLSVVSAAFGVGLPLQRFAGGPDTARFILLALAPPVGAAAGLSTVAAAALVDAFGHRPRAGART